MTQLTLYRCSYSDCSNYGVLRQLAEDDTGNPLSSGAVLCPGSLTDAPGMTCGRILDRLAEGPDGPADHTPSDTPQPPPPAMPASPDAIAAEKAAAAQVLTATNQANVLHQRNRWLAQTDPYVLPTGALPSDMPADVLDAIKASQSQIVAWRQQLRDYPGSVTDWTKPPPLPAPPNIPLSSGRQLIIVT